MASKVSAVASFAASRSALGSIPAREPSPRFVAFLARQLQWGIGVSAERNELLAPA
jgi:hypothetical protein